MDDQTDFLEQGFDDLRNELLDTLGDANLHLQPETITRCLHSRVRAKLKVLETLLRRLLVLLAMRLDLAPVRPRAARPASPLPEGAEDVTASFRAHLPPQYRMVLMPRPLGPPGNFNSLKAVRQTGPALAMPLLRRAAVLLRIIKQPEAAARRIARLIERMRARGDTKLYCPPLAGRHRLRPELSLLAGAIGLQVNAAMADWPVPVRPICDPDTS
ncbi:hypothetical protein [uncultured Hyphomonas sp.]|uniref:hypothetical protein n=1 Tax=uncultured Hyphomonas sp. TaxID=225298 RepID=UPI00374A0BAA